MNIITFSEVDDSLFSDEHKVEHFHSGISGKADIIWLDQATYTVQPELNNCHPSGIIGTTLACETQIPVNTIHVVSGNRAHQT